MSTTRSHWDAVWADRDPASVSWYQAEPSVSLGLIAALAVDRADPIIDVGGGMSSLTTSLVRTGHRDLTVLDIAQAALDALDASLRAEHGSHEVRLVHADVLDWQPARSYRLWHDRAVNHFLIDAEDRRRYVELAGATVSSGGHLLLASFAADGPDECSGLPVHRADDAALAAEFDASFDLARIRHELHRTPWQTTQSFHYLLLRRR